MGRAQSSTSRRTFDDLLAATAAEIDALLDRLISGNNAPAEGLVAAMRYALLGGGKRLRPFLLVESAKLFGVPRHRALRAGAALECVHCYSLIHDDLPAMDDDDLRRGKPTVHKAFDEATAILAGDALLTFAFELLSDPDTHPDASVRVTLIEGLAKAAGKDGMAGGQMLDLAAQGKSLSDPAGVLRLQAMKTGALFRYACEAGAILGESRPDDRQALRQYAEDIGIAFQIADDILDRQATPAARDHARQLVSRAKSALAPFAEKAAILAAAADYVLERSR
jgi:farnesyl diphosphate synthase